MGKQEEGKTSNTTPSASTPDLSAMTEKMKDLTAQLGVYYTNREICQKTIDRLEAQLEGMKMAHKSLQAHSYYPEL